MMPTPRRAAALAVPCLLAMAVPAAAHHPMGGETPRSWVEGLLSGLGHPVIGPDHLAFLLAAGALAALVSSGGAALLPLVFLAAGLAGTLLHLGGIGLGPVELAVAASLLAAGGLLLLWRDAPARAIAALFAAAGLFHGHAFAEAIVGAEPAPLLAYLLGLALVQGAIAYGAMALVRRAGTVGGLRLSRLAGAGACAAGLVFGTLALAGA